MNNLQNANGGNNNNLGIIKPQNADNNNFKEFYKSGNNVSKSKNNKTQLKGK